MKITDFTEDSRTPRSTIKARILRYLQEHEDEVFSYRDEKLAKDLGVKISALSYPLWSLHSEGLIEREKLGGRVYFGSHKAVAALRKRLGMASLDPFARALANRGVIQARTGVLSAVELLDEVRGSFE
jgi:hypothetical protein